jgi:hypothetical protein
MYIGKKKKKVKVTKRGGNHHRLMEQCILEGRLEKVTLTSSVGFRLLLKGELSWEGRRGRERAWGRGALCQ